ncbi:Hypothetical predicted protein [Mytilus galloprovincialis]|uniref:B box-type domain-containing protein n=1 Tax=Mytilus galloprovincialis TaxID=29158 RepID=A0A8B6EAI1_MYTGA|nr:Hypothetical predicted protein [Mytilus galloprovincialis]
MAEGTTVSCEPCVYNGLSKSAQIWCNDCGEGFCDECVKGHNITKLLRSHHLISITDYWQITELLFDEKCEQHKEPYEFFCSQHDAILCLNCFKNSHNTCKISKLSEVAKGSKTSTALTDLENQIQSTKQNLAKYHEEEDTSKTDLKQQEQSIRDEVCNIRRKLNNQLDELQENLLRDLELKYDNCTKHVNDYCSANDIKVDDIKALHKRISNLKMYASEKQVFIGIRHIGNILLKQKQEVRKNFSKHKRFSLKLKVNDNVLSLLLELKSLGDIVVREMSDTVMFNDHSKKQAQHDIQKNISINEINLKFHNSVEITHLRDTKLSLTACAILPTKHCVFVDNKNGKLIIHNEDGKFIGVMRLNEIFDITPIGSSMIGVVTDSEVKIVDINTKEIVKTIIDYGFPVWGICYENEKLYCMHNRNINIFDLDGTVSKYIPVEYADVYNLAVHKDHIYFISLTTKTLYAIDHSGKQLWTFHDNRLQRPKCFLHSYSSSLDVDNHGNVFIVLPDYNQVIVISSDGQQHRVILDQLNNMNGPSGISYCRETYQLLVCNFTNINSLMKNDLEG